MAVWVVRAGKYGEAENYALENNVAVIGWDELPDLEPIGDRESLLNVIKSTYDVVGEATAKNWETQLWAFSKRIRVGDIVSLPRKQASMVSFGECEGVYQNKKDAPEGAKHQIPVRWTFEIPRTLIDSDLRYSLGGAMTVFQIQRNNAEERIRALIEGRASAVARFREDSADEAASSDVAPDIFQVALDQITEHVGQRFRGHEMERLVEAILNAQGFTTDRTPAGPDGGVDIVAGRGVLGLESPRICVQVKTQQTPVDVNVLREMQGVLSNFGGDLGLIVSWGGFNRSVLREARRSFFQIKLWDAETLVKILQSMYDKLPEEVRKDIPLRRVWALVQDV